MANPAIIACALGQYTKVATNVTEGVIRLDQATDPGDVLQTFRLTGQGAPTDGAEGRQFPMKDYPIGAIAGIDVYLWPLKRAISVRVDV